MTLVTLIRIMNIVLYFLGFTAINEAKDEHTEAGEQLGNECVQSVHAATVTACHHRLRSKLQKQWLLTPVGDLSQ